MSGVFYHILYIPLAVFSFFIVWRGWGAVIGGSAGPVLLAQFIVASVTLLGVILARLLMKPPPG